MSDYMWLLAALAIVSIALGVMGYDAFYRHPKHR